MLMQLLYLLRWYTIIFPAQIILKKLLGVINWGARPRSDPQFLLKIAWRMTGEWDIFLHCLTIQCVGLWSRNLDIHQRILACLGRWCVGSAFRVVSPTSILTAFWCFMILKCNCLCFYCRTKLARNSQNRENGMSCYHVATSVLLFWGSKSNKSIEQKSDFFWRFIHMFPSWHDTHRVFWVYFPPNALVGIISALDEKTHSQKKVAVPHFMRTHPPPKLSKDSYLQLGRKASSVLHRFREEVYALYLRYEELKAELRAFDVLDVVHHVYHQLRTRRTPLPQSGLWNGVYRSSQINFKEIWFQEICFEEICAEIGCSLSIQMICNWLIQSEFCEIQMIFLFCLFWMHCTPAREHGL